MELCFSTVAKYLLEFTNQASLCPAKDDLKIRISKGVRKRKKIEAVKMNKFLFYGPIWLLAHQGMTEVFPFCFNQLSQRNEFFNSNLRIG